MIKDRNRNCVICNKVYKEMSKHLFEKDRKPLLVCPECKEKLKGTGKCVVKCQPCNNIVKSPNSFSKCPICNNPLMSKHLENIHKQNSSKGLCKICGLEVEKRDSCGRCIDCATKANKKVVSNNIKSGNCTKCEKYNIRYKKVTFDEINISSIADEIYSKITRDEKELNENIVINKIEQNKRMFNYK